MLSPPRVDPSPSFDDALARFARLRARDDETILPGARSVLLHHGSRTADAVLLLHGFTNHPGQYREFAPLAHARGANVLVPRLPEHGDRDRLTRRPARLTAQTLLDEASSAFDIACGLGERVHVAGISAGALLCAYLGQTRPETGCALAVAPEFALLQWSRRTTTMIATVARALPNVFLWWDPRVKMQMRPLTAYPRFPTRALAQTLLVGDDLWHMSAKWRAAAQVIRVAVNPNDPAVNNRVAEAIVRRWQRCGSHAEFIVLQGLDRNHDVIEPDNPRAQTAIVYPQLLDLLFRETRGQTANTPARS